MASGELDRRVAFLQRPPIDADAGNERGDFEPLCEMWAGFTPMAAQSRESFGIAEDATTGWLKIRECSAISTLTNADRVVFCADPLNEFAIDEVPVKNRSGYRLLRISRKM